MGPPSYILYVFERNVVRRRKPVHRTWSQRATRSKGWVCGLSLPGIAGSNPAGACGCLSFM